MGRPRPFVMQVVGHLPGISMGVGKKQFSQIPQFQLVHKPINLTFKETSEQYAPSD